MKISAVEADSRDVYIGLFAGFVLLLIVGALSFFAGRSGRDSTIHVVEPKIEVPAMTVQKVVLDASTLPEHKAPHLYVVMPKEGERAAHVIKLDRKVQFPEHVKVRIDGPVQISQTGQETPVTEPIFEPKSKPVWLRAEKNEKPKPVKKKVDRLLPPPVDVPAHPAHPGHKEWLKQQPDHVKSSHGNSD